MPRSTRISHSKARPLLWGGLILLAAALAGGWYFWRDFFQSGPRFEAVLLNINQETRTVKAGAILVLRPWDRLKIERIITNLPLNIHLRLTCPGLDFGALRFEELPLLQLLPGQDPYNHYRFEVCVKYKNAELASLTLEIRPLLEDWLERAERVIDPTAKAQVLEKALHFHPGEKCLLRPLADTYKSVEAWEKAAALVEQMLNGQNDLELLRESLAAYTAAGNEAAVIAALERLVAADPEDRSSRERLARLLDHAGRAPEEAAAHYEALLLLTPDKQRAHIHARLGLIYARSGRHQDAIRHYQALTGLLQDDPNPYYNLAYVYEQLGDVEKEEFYLESALELNQDDRDGRLKLAHRLVERGRYEKAHRWLDEVLQTPPDDYEALLLMAQVLEKLDRKEDLRRLYPRILALDPQNEAARYNLGLLEYEAGDFAAALSQLSAYAQRHPDDATLQGVLFDIHRRMGDTTAAIRTARQLISLTPRNLPVYDFLFETLQEQKDYQGISEIMQHGIDFNPETAILRQYLLLACLETGREDLAIEQLETLVRLAPDNSKYWLLLARLREKNQQTAEAAEAYQRVLALTPQNEEAAAAYLRLRLQKLDRQPQR